MQDRKKYLIRTASGEQRGPFVGLPGATNEAKTLAKFRGEPCGIYTEGGTDHVAIENPPGWEAKVAAEKAEQERLKKVAEQEQGKVIEAE